MAYISLKITEISKWKQDDDGAVREWSVPGFLDGIDVSAFVDYGSGINVLSKDFAMCHGLKPETSSRKEIKLPSKSSIWSLGSLHMSWRFLDDSKPFPEEFHVIENCVHHVILGKRFVESTKLFTNSIYRLQQSVCQISRPARLNLLEPSLDRILGTMNGHLVSALADSGSDVLLLSKDLAESIGLTVESEDSDRMLLELADGSIVSTSGIVRNVRWSFGSHGSPSMIRKTNPAVVPRFKAGGGSKQPKYFLCDFHVMDHLPCMVVLSNGFLFDTEAFSNHKDLFFEEMLLEESGQTAYEFSQLNLIRLLRKDSKFKRLLIMSTRRKKPSTHVSRDDTQQYEFEKELHRRSEAEDMIANQPVEKQAAMWQAELTRREQWTRRFNNTTPRL